MHDKNLVLKYLNCQLYKTTFLDQLFKWPWSSETCRSQWGPSLIKSRELALHNHLTLLDNRNGISWTLSTTGAYVRRKNNIMEMLSFQNILNINVRKEVPVNTDSRNNSYWCMNQFFLGEISYKLKLRAALATMSINADWSIIRLIDLCFLLLNNLLYAERQYYRVRIFEIIMIYT